MNDTQLFNRLFFGNENIDKEVFTKINMMISHGHSVRLEFDDQGVSVSFKGQEGNIFLHHGTYQIELGGCYD